MSDSILAREIAGEMGIPPDQSMNPEQYAEFKRRFQERRSGAGPGLEERVTALEEMAAHPLRSVTPREISEEQAREFERDWQMALGKPQQLRVLPPRQPLTEDEVRQLLRECVTVVRPGEILVIQVSENFAPNQLREYQDSVTWWLRENAPDIKALVIPGKVASRAPGHLHAAGDPATEDLFAHMSSGHSMHMTGFGLEDMAKIHVGLHGPQHVAAAHG